MAARSPAQLYALVFGVVLVVAGIVGFFYDASFDTGNAANAHDVFGILSVNGWHNVVHILTGLLGLLAFSNYGYARTYAFGLGAVYILIAAIGFINGNGFLFDFLPLNTEDNFL